MQAKKCDRCGVFYISNSCECFSGNKTSTDDFYTKETVGVELKTIHKYSNGDHKAKSKYYDLCDDCISAFHDWINTKEGDNNV